MSKQESRNNPLTTRCLARTNQPTIPRLFVRNRNNAFPIFFAVCWRAFVRVCVSMCWSVLWLGSHHRAAPFHRKRRIERTWRSSRHLAAAVVLYEQKRDSLYRSPRRFQIEAAFCEKRVDYIPSFPKKRSNRARRTLPSSFYWISRICILPIDRPPLYIYIYLYFSIVLLSTLGNTEKFFLEKKYFPFLPTSAISYMLISGEPNGISFQWLINRRINLLLFVDGRHSSIGVSPCVCRTRRLKRVVFRVE